MARRTSRDEEDEYVTDMPISSASRVNPLPTAPARTSAAASSPQAAASLALSPYLSAWSQRHTQAEHVDREIQAMAFPHVGATPGMTETLAGEDPAAVGFTPAHVLNHEQVLRKWDVPDLPPSHHEGFGSSVTASNPATGAQNLEKEVGRLSERMAAGGHPDPLGQIVTNRRASLATSLESGTPDSEWYQGKAQALIHHEAVQADVPATVMRKVTAAESPRMPWDHTYADNSANRKSGQVGQTVFPNVAAAGRIVEAAKGRTPDEAHAEVAARGIPGVGRGSAARVASRMLTGDLRGSDPIPLAGEAEKIQSFDVNLSDPTHPEYGHSDYVATHQLKAHTADVQDARAGGYHEEQMEVPRPMTTNKKGETVPEGKAFHERMLDTPAGADIAQSTALIARTEEFTHQRQQRGEEWARQNAHAFMAAPAQSMQWSTARTGGTVDVPEHIMAEYAARPQGRGHQGYDRGDRMSARDWADI